jgi:hypothetical protein
MTPENRTELDKAVAYINLRGACAYMLQSETIHEALAGVERVETLEAAIQRHRDLRGDDRCWMDDVVLYAVLDPSANPDFVLPPKCEFLKSCDRYWEQRQTDAEKDVSRRSDMTIAQLEAENDSLTRRNAELCRGIEREIENCKMGAFTFMDDRLRELLEANNATQ